MIDIPQRGAAIPAAGTAAVAAVWGTSGAFVRHIDLSAAQIAFARAAIGGLVLVSILLTPYAREHRWRPERWLMLVISGVLLAVHWWSFVLALQKIPIGTVLLGVYLAPMMVAVLAGRLLHEDVGVRQFGGLAVAVVGCVLIFQPSQTGGWGGISILGISAVSYAGSILAGKHALATAPPLAVSTVQLGTVAVLLAPAAVAGPASIDSGDLVRVGVLGLVHSAAAQLVFIWCLRSLPATTAGILLYLEPVSAIATGWLVLAEMPTPATVAGALLVLATGVLITLSSTSTPLPSAAGTRPLQ
jgi:RarD protein